MVGQVEVLHYDMDSEEGMAEGAFRDVSEIPTTIVDDGGQDMIRWAGVIPDSEEIQSALQSP